MKKSLLLIACIAFFSHCKSGKAESSSPTVPAQGSFQAWTLTPFSKVDSLNPILRSSTTLAFDCPIQKKSVNWEEKNVFNPACIVKDGKVFMLYRAQDNAGTSRIGLAVSDDGLHFSKTAKPVLFPDNDDMKKYEWPGGIEDPRIVQSINNQYIMTYTAYDGKTARLCLATSTDLIHWNKKGLVLNQAKYLDQWSKSGAIIAKQTGDKVIAQKINGKYSMYFGDTDLFIAFSNDLIHWTPLEDENGKLVPVLHPRPFFHDSRLVESGPYALATARGIALIYNGMNAKIETDVSLPVGTYSAGQALFSPENPAKLVDRTATNFFRPDKPYEKIGEVNDVCFLEGMIHFNRKWFIYYGTADSKIAVAVCDKEL